MLRAFIYLCSIHPQLRVSNDMRPSRHRGFIKASTKKVVKAWLGIPSRPQNAHILEHLAKGGDSKLEILSFTSSVFLSCGRSELKNIL